MGLRKFGLKKSQFRFWKIWSRKKVWVLVSKKFLTEKCLGFGFDEFGLGKKILVSENSVSKKSLDFGFGKLGLGKEKIKIIRI